MIKKILLGLAVVMAVLILLIATRPTDFRYSRSITIAAPPAVLFDQVNDLRKFQEWNPWAKVDPAAKIAYSGPATGVDSAYSWAGNSNVGEGKMTITESRPNELVQARMDFIKPMAATHTAEFTFKPEGNQTVVTWSMAGQNNFAGKAFGLFLDCEQMVGNEFSKGLAALKTLTEK